MIFHTTHRYTSTLSPEEIKQRLLGKHVKIHDLDFEIFEKEGLLKIIPHAEQVETVKSLPISNVHLEERGAKETAVRLTSHMRRIDAGGPTLVVIFSFFMMVAGIAFYVLGGPEFVGFGLPVFAIGLLIFIVLMVRLQQGYYDYTRKVKTYVRSLTAPK